MLPVTSNPVLTVVVVPPVANGLAAAIGVIAAAHVFAIVDDVALKAALETVLSVFSVLVEDFDVLGLAPMALKQLFASDL